MTKTWMENRMACPVCCSARVMRVSPEHPPEQVSCIDCAWTGTVAEAREQFEELVVPSQILADLPFVEVENGRPKG